MMGRSWTLASQMAKCSLQLIKRVTHPALIKNRPVHGVVFMFLLLIATRHILGKTRH